MAPVFLHISRKLHMEILEQLCVYWKNLLGLCVRKCGNRGAVVVVVQTLCRRSLTACGEISDDPSAEISRDILNPDMVAPGSLRVTVLVL